ncbi:uncharacterized protein At5g19025-like [Andrographis paniculata]|uniref:uncharacterized protein At5g19025-like n=1 Tax=Andrographis paniculata TaxID=175694 RepID=UPI0021E8F75D|nr:uncharacterized protein At5g19025-like [Andrographis paniculata]
MSLPVVDCRNLIQFCRAFHLHNSSPINSNSSRPRAARFVSDSVNPFSNDFCHRSPFLALDLIILLSVLASLAFLFLPYFKFFLFDLLPLIHGFILDLILDAPLPYFVGFLLALLGLILAMLIDIRLRKCGNPHCKGLRRAVEYDIQLETEQCVKHSPPSADAYQGNHGAMQLELGQDRKELEAELKKMAPLNGRTVLIFRAPCGCPAGRLEDYDRRGWTVRTLQLIFVTVRMLNLLRVFMDLPTTARKIQLGWGPAR